MDGGSAGGYPADQLWGFSKNLIVLKGGGTVKGWREAFAALAGGHCQLRLKISHFCRSKISHFERASVPPDAVFGVSDSVELRVTGLAQRPPRVWRRQPGYPQRAGVTAPVSV